MIDDDLENELLAQLDMLMDPPAKSGSATDSKGKAVAEEVDFDINLPTQEQISFAIMTMQELLGGVLPISARCRTSQPPLKRLKSLAEPHNYQLNKNSGQTSPSSTPISAENSGCLKAK
ncbi:hypothetical protein SLEP1_g43176 [Rubroshorea leprosula]|nr:hypothetical protein SLEP1_g43176 [Rubroshorea leprosula]